MMITSWLPSLRDRGVSPVISVILMVAIVVILAAVTTVSVFGLTENISSTAPQAHFEFEFDSQFVTDYTYGYRYITQVVTVTHVAGDEIESGNLLILPSNTDIKYINDNNQLRSVDTGYASEASFDELDESGTVIAGDSVQIAVVYGRFDDLTKSRDVQDRSNVDFLNESSLRIVYDDGTDTTATLVEWEGSNS